MKKGISIIVLIITIIIMLIIAGVIISSVTEDGIIYKAREAAFKEDISKFKDELEIYKSNNYNQVMKNPLNTTTYEQTKNIITSLTSKYEDVIRITNNELVYIPDDNSEQLKWIKSSNIKIQEPVGADVILKLSASENGKITASKGKKTLIIGNNNIKAGDSIKLTAVAESANINSTNIEYEFAGWYENETLKSTDANYTAIIDSDCEYKAVFLPKSASIIYYTDANGNEQKIIDTNNIIVGYAERTDITKVIFGKNVTKIDGSAFKNCTGLKSIEIPENVTSTGYGSFLGCEVLNDIIVRGNMSLGVVTFYLAKANTISLPKTTFIPIQTFKQSSIKKIIIGSVGNPVTSIFGDAFQYCNAGEIKIYITNGTDSIANAPQDSHVEFYDAKTGELVNIYQGIKYAGNTTITTIPNIEKISRINSSAFKGCIGLKDIDISEKVEYIGYGAFMNCTGLNNVIVEGKATLGPVVFCQVKANTILLPKVSVIPMMAFKDSTITTITIGSKGNPVTFIPTDAFKGCRVTNVNIFIAGGTNSIANAPANTIYFDADTGEQITN